MEPRRRPPLGCSRFAESLFVVITRPFRFYWKGGESELRGGDNAPKMGFLGA